MNWAKFFFYSFVFALLCVAMYFYRFIFSYLAAALVVSFLMDPLVGWFERRLIPRWLSILIVYILILSLLAWFSIRFAPLLSLQASEIISRIKAGQDASALISLPILRDISQILESLDKAIPNLQSEKLFIDALSKGLLVLNDLPNLLINNISGIIGTISFIASVPLLSFFVIKDKYKFRKGMMTFVPNRYFELALILIQKIDETVGRFFRALLFEVLIVWFMVSVAFSIVGVPYPILIGAIAGFANIIPYLGPFSGWLLAALTILISGAPTILVLWAALAMYIVQVIDNNIVYPVVVGTTIDMHPLIVLLTVIAAGWIGGVPWMLFSVPLVYIIYSLTKVLYLNLKAYKII